LHIPKEQLIVAVYQFFQLFPPEGKTPPSVAGLPATVDSVLSHGLTILISIIYSYSAPI